MKFKITIERNEDIFDDVKGISKIYAKTKQKVFFNTVITLFRGWKHNIKEENKFIFIEEGTEEFIKKEKVDWERFVFGEDKELFKNNKYKEIRKVVNDRGVKNIINKIKKVPTSITNKLRDKAIKMALNDGTVLMFFLKMGVSIVWEIEP